MTFRKAQRKIGWMYILECADGSYYTGSTNNLEVRIQQHQNGEGANHTKKRLPVKLIYFEEFQRIDEAFYREKQVQGWSRKKKEALMKGFHEKLPQLSLAYRDLPREASCISSASMRETTTQEPNPKPESLPEPSSLSGSNPLSEPSALLGSNPLPEPSALSGTNPLPEALEGNTTKLKR